MMTTRTRSGGLPLNPCQSAVYNSNEKEMDITEEIECRNEQVVNATTTIVNPNVPVFATIQTNVIIENGLCILRNLGNSRYEIVRLSRFTETRMGEPDVGKQIESAGERKELFTALQAGMRATVAKIEHACASANKEIFPFMRLPLEIRDAIYEISVKILGPIRIRPSILCTTSRNLVLNLRCASNQVLNESNRHFYRNNFHVSEMPKDESIFNILHKVGQNMVEVTFEWWGWAQKDPTTLAFIRSLPNVKVLNVSLTEYCINGGLKSHKKQHLFQEIQSIEKFNKSNGFDALVQFRGLEKVKVHRSPSLSLRPSNIDLNDDEIKVLEVFLNAELTKPHIIRASLKGRKSKRARSGGENDDDYEP
ncbi:hypothetical protein BGZ60DRAFT_564706 [Tricladium varicosporioides]|nr:hypothetical protein BGZ60DRAFT_564706 [Hymenoscyphus varicosporioides]